MLNVHSGQCLFNRTRKGQNFGRNWEKEYNVKKYLPVTHHLLQPPSLNNNFPLFCSVSYLKANFISNCSSPWILCGAKNRKAESFLGGKTLGILGAESRSLHISLKANTQVNKQRGSEMVHCTIVGENLNMGEKISQYS